MKALPFDLKSSIKDYLITSTLSYPKYKNGSKCITLLVEGDLDFDIYTALGKLSTNNNTSSYLFSPISAYEDFREYLRLSMPFLLDYYYNAFDYVIDGVNSGINRKDCYGIIDSDLGQHGESTTPNLSITETHDHETLLIKCYFDMFVNGIIRDLSLTETEKRQLMQDISSILLFTVQQGLLEKAAIAATDEEQRPFLSFVSHSYFEKCDYNGQPFDNLISDAISEFVISQDPRFVLKYQRYGEKLRKKYEIIKGRKRRLIEAICGSDLISKWVCHGYDHLGREEQALIQDICWFTNGHFFVNHFKRLLQKDYGAIFSPSEKYSDYFNKPMIEYLSNNKEIYCSFDPIKQYKSNFLGE